MKVKIPDKVKVIGKYYNVVHEDNLFTVNGNYGETRYNKAEIAVQKIVDGANFPTQEIDHTFFHELIHAILREIGEKELNDNERFVDTFSNVLYQVFTDNELME